MAKEKTEFEIRANTLKAMAKQCTAKVVTAAEQNTSCSVTERLYGERECSIHVAFYKGLLVGVMPYHTPEQFLEEMPCRGHYFDAIRDYPNGKETAEEKTEEQEEENA